jgi:hypothetical protein
MALDLWAVRSKRAILARHKPTADEKDIAKAVGISNMTPESPTRMTEGEVAIRLAEHLLSVSGAADHTTVAIDGAVVEIAGRGRLFEIEQFLATNGWRLTTNKVSARGMALTHEPRNNFASVQSQAQEMG